jgi:hypothetical protein
VYPSVSPVKKAKQPGSTAATTGGLDFSNGFAAAGSQLTVNGSAALKGSKAELTDGGGSEAGSAFTTAKVGVARFTTSFGFHLSAGTSTADGFTFTLQGVGPTALGALGGGLGYAADPSTGLGNSIASSVAIKFDLADNAGEGDISTGLYLNGAAPTLPATNLTGTGINLHSGDAFGVTLVYNGTTLNVTITDQATRATATQSYTVDIVKAVGGSQAFAGFTGGTGDSTATQDILNWTYTAQ